MSKSKKNPRLLERRRAYVIGPDGTLFTPREYEQFLKARRDGTKQR